MIDDAHRGGTNVPSAARWGLPLAVTLILGALTIWQGERMLSASEPEPAQLETDVAVEDIDEAWGGQTVDVTLHNRGDERAIVKHAELRITAVAEIKRCYSQGGGGGPIEPTGTYAAEIPARAAPGDTIPVQDLKHQIGGDEVDRMTITINSAPDALTPAEGIESIRRIYRLELLLSGPESLTRAGPVVVALPYLPIGIGYHWTQDLLDPAALRSTFGGGFPFEALPCWRRNARELKRILALPGARTPALADLESDVTTPWGR